MNVSYEERATKDRGRALFAKKKFKIDDVILEEKPFVSSQFAWNKAYRYLACDYCMRPLETATENCERLAGENTSNLVLPYAELCLTTEYSVKKTECPDCGELYCSIECHTRAFDEYHKTLCLKEHVNNECHPVNLLIEEWKKIHYPPETTSITLLIRLLGMYKQSKNRKQFLEAIQQYQSVVINENLMLQHKLLSSHFQEHINVLYPLYRKAFEHDPELELFLTQREFKNLLAIVAINGQGIGTTSFGEWAQKVLKLELPPNVKDDLQELINDLYERLEIATGMSFLNNEGSGLYLAQSKINHSCAPNAESKFPYCNNVIVINALRTIQPNEEICISYLDDCQLDSSRHTRQKYLKANYLFECQCVKCMAEINAPDVTSEEEEEDDDDDEGGMDDGDADDNPTDGSTANQQDVEMN